jgi:Ca2+-binding RTX toxin-like protein
MTSFVIHDLESTSQFVLNGEFGILTSTGTIAPATGSAIIAQGSYVLDIDGTAMSVAGGSALLSAATVSATITVGDDGRLIGSAGGNSAGIAITASDTVTITNAGMISGSGNGIAVDYTLNSVNLFLTNTGRISSRTDAAVSARLDSGVASGDAVIINSGIISTMGTGSASPYAIYLQGSSQGSAMIVNTGQISTGSKTSPAIYVTNVPLTLQNAGTITGDVTVTGQADITNTGTIIGSIFASSWNDTFNLTGGTVTGTVSGGNGSDTYIVSSTTHRLSEAGALGEDTVQSFISWTLGSGFENLVLVGTAASNGTGNFNDNTLTGNDADNRLVGRGGNDTLIGGAGEDTLIGGRGSDTYYRIDADDILVEGAFQGTDTVVIDNSAADLDLVSYTLAANFENLEFVRTTGITAIGNSAANVITTGSGNDTLNGTTGTDTLNGGAGNDTYITNGGDTLSDSSGTDTVQSSVSFTLAAAFENLVLTGTAVTGTGNAGINRITGNAGANSLNGLLGVDTLTGGGGADNFLFTTTLSPNNIDKITDFNPVADTIRIDNAVFTGLTAGALAATAFVQNTTGKAADASDRIIYETDTGALWFDRDGTGAATAVQFATLNTKLAITNADFFVF